MSYSYRAYGLDIESSADIAALEVCAHKARKVDLYLENCPEPEWASRARELPGRVLCERSENAGTPSFVLTQRGDAEHFELWYSDGAQFVVDMMR